MSLEEQSSRESAEGNAPAPSAGEVDKKDTDHDGNSGSEEATDASSFLSQPETTEPSTQAATPAQIDSAHGPPEKPEFTSNEPPEEGGECENGGPSSLFVEHKAGYDADDDGSSELPPAIPSIDSEFTDVM